MPKLTVALIASLFAANLAFAQAAAPVDCAAQAAEKKLAGAAKNSFMKKCEKDNPAPKAEAKTDGRKAQQEKMKACNKEAGEKKLKGKERKEFMSGCLKG